jgi:hypothetical protein
MIEVFEDFETLLNNGVAFLPFDVCDKTNTTGIVFMCWVVKSLGFWQANNGRRIGHSGF